MSKSRRICEFCKIEFMAYDKEIRRGWARFCSKSCKSKAFPPMKKDIIRPMNSKCSLCKKEFYKSDYKKSLSKSGHVFCGKTCKNQAQRIGGVEGMLPSQYGSIGRATKGELINSSSANWNNKVRSDARRVYNTSSSPKHCVYCGYDTHYEVCHIRAVSDFPPEALVSDINALSNLVALCPNHHWEFDNGKLQWSDIVMKMSEITAEELEDLVFEE